MDTIFIINYAVTSPTSGDIIWISPLVRNTPSDNDMAYTLAINNFLPFRTNRILPLNSAPIKLSDEYYQPITVVVPFWELFEEYAATMDRTPQGVLHFYRDPFYRCGYAITVANYLAEHYRETFCVVEVLEGETQQPYSRIHTTSGFAVSTMINLFLQSTLNYWTEKLRSKRNERKN